MCVRTHYIKVRMECSSLACLDDSMSDTNICRSSLSRDANQSNVTVPFCDTLASVCKTTTGAVLRLQIKQGVNYE